MIGKQKMKATCIFILCNNEGSNFNLHETPQGHFISGSYKISTYVPSAKNCSTHSVI